MIRQATIDDIPAILKLSKALFLDPSSKSDIHADPNWPISDNGRAAFEGALKDGFLWVSEGNSKVVGFICAELSPVVDWRPIKRIELLSFYIAPEYRSKGVGAKLVSELEKWALDQGAKTIFVSAYSDNVKGIDFYKKMDFHDYSVELEKELT